MENKEIYIDGVDVSGCMYYKATGKYNTCGYPDCSKNPNCYYEKWQRKEQECERLSKGYAELTDIVEPYMGDFTGYNEELGGFDIVLCVKEILDQLKKENEELKEINSKLLEHRKHSATCQECYKDGLEDGLSQNKTLHKYKQALTKIKEIAEANTGRFPDGSIFARPEIEQILQKISECEVIDENNRI